MTAYTDFLSDKLHVSNFLAEVHYVNPADGSTGVYYWTMVKFGTKSTDSLVSKRFDRRIIEGYNFSSNSGSSEDGIGTITGLLPAREGGTLRIAQSQGDLDTLRNYSFDGQQIIIRHGGSSPKYGVLGYDDYKIVFNGECGGQPLIGLDEITFQLRNKDTRFEHPIQDRRYYGGDWCLNFDGGGNTVDCGTNAAFNFTSGDFTIQAWIYTGYIGADEYIFTRGVIATSGWSVLRRVSGAVSFQTHQAGATQTTTSTALTLDRWQHIAIVRAGADATIYIDGVASNASSATHIDPATFAGNLYWGKNNSGTSAVLSGYLDEVRISNVALTRAQILKTMYHRLTPVEITASYVGYWPLEDGTGATATDSSATAAHGTITGATWMPSLQGGDDLEGSPLPDVWGARFGVPPNLVDVATRIYQIHSGPVNSLVGVYEGGNAITIDPAWPTPAAALGNFSLVAPAAGTYRWASTEYGSFIRLGSNPSLPITIDVQGDKSGGTYRSKASDIWRYIVCNRGPNPLTDATDIDDAAFDTLAAAATQAVGMDYASEISIAEVGNFLLGSIGAASWFKRDSGLLTARRFTGVAAETSVLTLTKSDIEIGTLEPLDAGPPVWAVNVAWKKNSLVHSTAEIAGAVVGTARWAFMLKEWRTACARNETVRDTYKGAVTLFLETGLSLWVDARAEADRKLALFASPPQAFRAFFTERATQLDRFDAVIFHFQDGSIASGLQDRLGTSATAKYIVLAADDDTAKSGTMLTLYRETMV